MEAPARASSWRCRADEVPPGRTARFELKLDGRAVAGFLVNHGGRHRAYVNRCPHAGTPLDWWPNEFLTEAGFSVVCATHGAVFDPDTGICTEARCPGARLERLPVLRDGEDLVVTCPD